MLKSVRVLSVAALAVAPVIFGMAVPAGASAHVSLRVGAHVRPADFPNSNIKGKGETLKYAPKKLKVAWGGPAGAACDDTTESLTLTNTTKATVQPTIGGEPLGSPLAAGTGEILCATGSGKDTFVLGLDGSNNTLTLKLR